MKRIFSDKLQSSPTLSSAATFLAPPRNLFSDSSSTVGSDKASGKTDSRSRSSSFGRIFSNSSDSGKNGSGLSSKQQPSLPKEQTMNTLSPELIPIVTLLSAQSHRRYHEGVFLILKDLDSDGSPAQRVWKEVYGVLIGTQLALWDARELSNNENDVSKLMDATLKPTYINFTDAQLRMLDPSDTTLQVEKSSRKNIENTIVVSTTLKNRFFLQFSDKDSFHTWVSAFRLSAFEFTLLQEAYTGAFLSTRGAKLSDIKVILADTKFDYEDWVSVRFGAGMPWKRCYAVISQPTKRSKSGKKKYLGQINFYENDKKTKKTKAMATVTDAYAVYAIYAQSPVLIDTSTMIKLEGVISFSKNDTPKDTDIFVMPEKHYAVPGYDTIIRFLIPTMNAFNLYGRPKRLIANKDDPESLLFALPTLPHIHYLQVDDVLLLTKQASSSQWKLQDWRRNLKELLSKKQSSGYTGCGSTAGLAGALQSPAIGSAELFDRSPNSPVFMPVPLLSTTPTESRFEPQVTSPLRLNSTTPSPTDSVPVNANGKSAMTNNNASGETSNGRQISLNDYAVPSIKNDAVSPMDSSPLASLNNTRSFSTPLEQNPVFSNSEPRTFTKNRNKTRVVSSHEMDSPNYTSFAQPKPFTTSSLSKTPNNAPGADSQKPDNGLSNGNARLSDLSQIYDNYRSQKPGSFTSPSQNSNEPDASFDSHNSIVVKDASSAYNEYTGSPKVKKFDISNVGAASSDDVLEDFYQLSKQISALSINSEANKVKEEAKKEEEDFDFSGKETSYAVASDNVFDPDYMEENDMLDMESRYTKDDFKNNASTDSLNHDRFYEAHASVQNSSQMPYNDMASPPSTANSYNSNVNERPENNIEKKQAAIPRSKPVPLHSQLMGQSGSGSGSGSGANANANVNVNPVYGGSPAARGAPQTNRRGPQPYPSTQAVHSRPNNAMPKSTSPQRAPVPSENGAMGMQYARGPNPQQQMPAPQGFQKRAPYSYGAQKTPGSQQRIAPQMMGTPMGAPMGTQPGMTQHRPQGAAGKPMPMQNRYGNSRPAPQQQPLPHQQQYVYSQPQVESYQQYPPNQPYPQKYPVPNDKPRQALNQQYNKPKPSSRGGFSQFMPPQQSNANPYAH